MGLRRFALLGLLVASVAHAAIHYEDNQLHVFPGGVVDGRLMADVTAFGADPGGIFDSTPGFTAAILSSTPIVSVPPGTFAICNVPLTQSNQTIQCSPETIITPTATCGTGNPFIGSGTVDNVRITGCHFVSVTSHQTAMINVNSTSMTRLTVDHNQFDLTGGGFGLFATGMYGLVVTDNQCYGAGPGLTNANQQTCFESFRGGGQQDFERNTMEFTYNGVIIAETFPGDTTHVRYVDNFADPGWTVIPTRFTNSGGTVTYSPTVLTDTAATFTGTPALTDVRVLPTRTSGTVTNCPSGGASGAKLCDTGNNFFTAGVRRGDIVRTATAFATVNSDAVNAGCTEGTCNQQLFLDQWRDRTTYRPVIAPANTTAYTIFQLLLCQVTSVTATTITCTSNTNGFEDFFGNSVTPSAGTLYEVMVNHPNYAFEISGNGSYRPQIIGNRHRRTWADAFGVQGGFMAMVSNNSVEDTMDGGITNTTDRSTMTGNMFFHCGSSGTFVRANSLNITSSIYVDNGWHNRNSVNNLGSDVDVEGAFTGVQISDNTMEKVDVTEVDDQTGIYLKQDTGTVVMNNHMGGHTNADIRLETSSTSPHLFYNHGASIQDAGATTVMVIDPELSVAVGSLASWDVGSLVKVTGTTAANPCAAGALTSIGRRIGGPAWACN